MKNFLLVYNLNPFSLSWTPSTLAVLQSLGISPAGCLQALVGPWGSPSALSSLHSLQAWPCSPHSTVLSEGHGTRSGALAGAEVSHLKHVQTNDRLFCENATGSGCG